MRNFREILESRQVAIYFMAVITAVLMFYLTPSSLTFDAAINPALAFMLFVTFLQVPLVDLIRAVLHLRFFITLFSVNFIAIPLLVLGLMQFLPPDPMIQIGVLLVLLTPCIDYVVTFAHLGKADAKLLLAATPALLLMQMFLLPIYLSVFMGDDVGTLVQLDPFIHAFIWLIAVPLLAAAMLQFCAKQFKNAARLADILGLMPVPATALVLFIVITAVIPQFNQAIGSALIALPVYIAFAVLAPAIGWAVARLMKLKTIQARSVAFSAGTRNSLVVLPLALAIPGAMPILPAIIVTQTLVELMSELLYIRVIGSLGHDKN
ncbi:arsenic resistance protein [Brucellaceae bacterium C25G]